MIDDLPVTTPSPVEGGNRLGDWAELMASTWLLESGFDVYRNVSKVGPVDVVGMRDGIAYFFDVKYTRIQFNKQGEATRAMSRAQKSRNQEHINVTFLYVTPEGICGFSEGEIVKKYNAIAKGR